MDSQNRLFVKAVAMVEYFVAELIRTTIKRSPDIFIIRNQRTTYKSAYNFLEDMGYE